MQCPHNYHQEHKPKDTWWDPVSKGEFLTEFQLKIVLSIPNPNGQRTNTQPNVSPSGNPMKFWCFLAMDVPTAHITQQNSLIGSFSKMEFFHWLQC